MKNSDLSKKASLWLFVLRLGVGWFFFYAGLTKVLDPSWSAEKFLMGAKTFPGLYAWFAQPGLVQSINLINEWALVVLGAALILGFFLRPAALFGILLMLLYYFASNAVPVVEHGFIVDEHIVLILILSFFVAIDAGDHWGLDHFLRKEERAKVENY